MNGVHKSLGHLSISQPSPKTTQKEKKNDAENIYRKPKYLKQSPTPLLRILRQQLKHRLLRKKEQFFVLSRLNLIDRHYCIDIYRQLWQSYYDLGTETFLWPDQIISLAQTTEHALIQQFVQDYLIIIQKQLDQCNADLQTTSLRCPLTLSVQCIDSPLRDLVSLHQRRLSKKYQCDLAKFKAKVHDNELWQALTSHHLTIDQLEVIDRIMTIHQRQMHVVEELSKLEQRILCNFLPKSFDLVTVDAPELTEIAGYQELTMKEKEKKLQRLKRTMLDTLVQAYEIKIVSFEHQYEQQMIELEKTCLHNNGIGGMSIVDSMKTYLVNRTKQFKADNRSNMTFFRRTLFRRRRRHCAPSKKNHIVGVCPQVIVDVPRLSLNHSQLAFISSGGTSYIRPNRTALCSDRHRCRLVEHDHKDLMTKSTSYLAEKQRIPKTAPIIKQLSNRLKDQLTFLYMTPLSLYDSLRARREHLLVKSILRKIKKGKLVLRPSDKSVVPHIGSESDYEKKAEKYRQDTGAYIELASNPLEEIVQKVKYLLDDLKSKKLIEITKHYNKMKSDSVKVHLAYMYFIPKAHKKDTPLRPIMNTINSPTTGISRFLDKLIRPLFDKHCRSTTLVDGTDLIHRLDQYVANGYLKPSTLFCTFDIVDLYTMLPQQESLEVLREFLLEHGCEKVNGISIDTIIQLATIVLTENAFVCGDKYYKQIIGGAMGSPFTLTLANIFMWKWQKPIVRRQIASNEIYGRYVDDVFFTSNEPKEIIERMLHNANDYHPNIKLISELGKSATFLDLRIENKDGILSTSVYHKEAAEPYVVPFKSDHPRHTFASIIQEKLARAVHFSSTLKIFDAERRSIKLLLLYNGYPSPYIATQFQKFFENYNVTTSNLVPIIEYDSEFYRVRAQLLNIPTIRQSQISRSITSVEFQQNQPNLATEVILPSATLVHGKPWIDRMILHYTHEKRLAAYKKDFHHIYNEIFAGTPASDVTVIVGNRNNASLKNELIRKRPNNTLLGKKDKKKKRPANANNSTAIAQPINGRHHLQR